MNLIHKIQGKTMLIVQNIVCSKLGIKYTEYIYFENKQNEKYWYFLKRKDTKTTVNFKTKTIPPFLNEDLFVVFMNSSSLFVYEGFNSIEK